MYVYIKNSMIYVPDVYLVDRGQQRQHGSWLTDYYKAVLNKVIYEATFGFDEALPEWFYNSLKFWC